MRLEQFLSESAVRFGKQAVVVAGGRAHAYAELERSSSRVAAAFAARGVSRGDRVALFMDDSFEAVVSVFAVLKTGAAAIPVDTTISADGLARLLVRTGAVAIVTEARLASVAATATSSVRAIRLVLLRGGDRSTASASCLIYEDVAGGIGPGPVIKRAGPAGDAALVLPWTATDSGPPEATLTHAEMIAAAGETAQDTRMPAAILSYYGLCQLFAAVRTGATVTLSPQRRAMQTQSTDEDGDDAVPALVA